ncbi:MAG: DinB family protein [Longimicrobiales bacterium]
MRLDDLGPRLRANADVVAALVRGVDDDQARWKPDPAQWSIVEVVNHLADEEVEDFRTRLDLTLHRPEEAWPRIDPQKWVAARAYAERDLSESLVRFLARRAETISWLTSLGAPDWERAHEHPRFGPIRAGDLMISWVAHDHIHIRQLNRLHREFLVASLPGHSPEYAGRW